MRPGRVVALVIGCLLTLFSLAIVLGGAIVVLASLAADDGYFEAHLERIETDTVAITAEDIDLGARPGPLAEFVSTSDADVRLRVTNADSGREIFVGIATDEDVDNYLSEIAHDVVDGVDADFEVELRRRRGGDRVTPPGEQSFWVETASGPGTQQLDWEATSGRWAVVVMNADGSPGVSADADVGVEVGLALLVGVMMLGLGGALTAIGVIFIVVGATGGARRPAHGEQERADGALSPIPAGAPTPPAPVTVQARLDAELSRWLWLVKWFLAIPHVIVLAFLWLAFCVLTVVAGFAILFTGRYPRGIFEFNVGVLRWTWRVAFYAATGGPGTDRYPPFSLGAEADYPATLDVVYPEQLSRGLVLVKWWLLAIPHYLIVGVLAGGTMRLFSREDSWWVFDPAAAAGLIGVLAFVAAVALLFTGRYPQGLFALIVGLNRWVYRVVVYAALMTDEYPPLRLDQGGPEPAVPATPAGRLMEPPAGLPVTPPGVTGT